MRLVCVRDRLNSAQDMEPVRRVFLERLKVLRNIFNTTTRNHLQYLVSVNRDGRDPIVVRGVRALRVGLWRSLPPVCSRISIESINRMSRRMSLICITRKSLEHQHSPLKYHEKLNSRFALEHRYGEYRQSKIR